jgi:hypothetical protein
MGNLDSYRRKLSLWISRILYLIEKYWQSLIIRIFEIDTESYLSVMIKIISASYLFIWINNYKNYFNIREQYVQMSEYYRFQFINRLVFLLTIRNWSDQRNCVIDFSSTNLMVCWASVNNHERIISQDANRKRHIYK